MVRGGKGSRSFTASLYKGLLKKIAMTVFVAANVLSITLAPAQPALAASFTFTQLDWAASADTSATAGHTAGAAQTGVTSFYSTSSSYLTTGENLTIATSTGSFAQTDWATVDSSNSWSDAEEEAAPASWTKASTTDSQIDYTTTSGSLQLDVTENTLTHTSSSDFSGSGSSATVSGSGDSASIVYSGTTATPIVREKLELAPVYDGGANYSAIDAVDANTIYVAQQKRSGSYYYVTVHKTTDGGASWTNTDARSGNVLSNYISIAAADANNVFVSSNQAGNGSGLFVTKTSDGGATWGTTTLDTTGTVHYQTSIAASDANNVFVSYYDNDTQDLKFGKSTDGGSTWATSTVDSTGSVGKYSSIKAVTDSTPGDGPTVYISYYDTTNTALKLAKSTNGGTSWTLSTPDSTTGDTGSWSSLQVTGENSLAIAYYRYYAPDAYTAYYHVRVITSSNGGSSWTTYTAASTNVADRPQYISLAAPDLTNLFVSYQSYISADLMYAASSNGGSSWSSAAAVDSTGVVGAYSSIDAVDANNVFIAYGDGSSSRVKIASSGYTASLGTYTSGSTNLGAQVELTTLALTKTANGTAVNSSGLNTYNQLGDGTTTSASTAVAVQGLGNVVSVSASRDGAYAYSLALLADGTVKAWGRNNYSQLGDGTTTQRTTPVSVSGISTAVAIAAGYTHSLALLSDGTVKAWGYNANGQLGDGSTTTRTTPVTVSGISTAVAIAAGDNYSLAVLADGTIKAWGSNTNGKLGDGTTTQRTTPVTVSGISTAVAVSASSGATSYAHSLALLSDGTVKAWGYNGQGQLGNGTTSNSSTPVTVSDISTAVAISAGGTAAGAGGGGHSLAILADGTAKAWGHNNVGQLGDGTTTAQTTPVAVSGLTDLISISAGGYYGSGGTTYTHSLALKSDGTVWGWGSNLFGAFANGGTTSSSTPVQSSLTNATYISAGAQFSLFITGGSLAQIAANTDNSTWTYKGVPIQAGRASTGGLSTLLGSSNQHVKYKLNLTTKSATATPSIDALALSYRGYPTSAAYSLISSPFNTENSSIGVSSVSWAGATTSSATLKFQVRTASSLSGLYSASWCGPTDCSGTDYFVDANNGASIANTTLTDGSNDQWFQYKAILQTSNAGETPVLNNVTVNYAIALDSTNGYSLISSPYNSGNTGNVIGGVQLVLTALPSGTSAKIQVRTSADGASWSAWCGTNCTDNPYFTATGTGTNAFTSIPSALTDGADDQWFQYRITLIPSSNNTDAPYVSSASVIYAVNAAPTVTNVVATTAATTQGAAETDAGKITVAYNLTDDASETSELNCVTSCDSYEAYLFYDVGVTLSSDNTTTLTVSDTSKLPSSGYVQIGTEVIKYTSIVNGTTLGSLTRGGSDNSWPGTSTRHSRSYSSGSVVWVKASSVTGDVGSVTTGSGKSIVWDPASESQLADYSKYDAKVRVLVHDDNLANQLSSQNDSSTDSSADVIIDNLAPTFSFTFDAGVAGETDTATVSMSTTGDATSTAQYMIADDAATHSTASSTPWTTFTTPGSKAWTFDSDFEAKTLSVQVRDPYGNAAATSTSSTLAPLSANAFVVADVSKVSASYWREFIGWETATSGDFASYKLDHAVSTDGVTYSAYATTTTPITTIGQNYFVHSDLTSTYLYRYRVGITGTNGNTSVRSSAYLEAKPDGTRNYDEGGGGDDTTAPTVTNVAEVEGTLKATSVSITFDATDGSSSITNATIYYATQADFTANAGETGRDRYTMKIGNPSYITVADSTPAEHTVALTNLIKDTTYRYAVESCDLIGNCQFNDDSEEGEDTGYTFTTRNGPAIVANSVQVTPSYNSASVTWKTDLPSDSIVFYATSGLSALVNPTSVGSNTQVTSADESGQYVHTVSIPNLSYPATYYYIVRSTDQNAASNSYTQYDESVIRSFDTEPQSPPTITSAPSCSTTNTTATVSWATDQLSTTEVSVLSANVSANYFSTTPGAQVAQYPTGAIDSASRATADYVTSHSNTFSGLTQSTTYYLKVRSLNSSGGEVSDTLTCATTATETLILRPAVVQDVTPPIINSMVIKDITASAVTITWQTDEPADSLVKYGLTSNYGLISGTEELSVNHEVSLGGLKPKTTYNFKVTSADGRGNRSYEGDQTVTTLSIEEEAAVTRQNLETLKQELEAVESEGTVQQKTESLEEAVQRFKAILRTVSSDVSLQDLEELTTDISDTITDITQELIPPAIIGGVPQVEVESNSAKIVWRTNKPSGSIIAVVPQDQYDAAATDPYTLQVGQPQEEVTQHTVTVPNLEPSTVYHFQIRSQAKVGPEGKSRDFVFETKPELPEIIDYAFKRITENSITVAWKTNTLSNSQVHYTPFDGATLLDDESRTQGTPEFVKDHEVTVTNLSANTNFLIEIVSADVTGAKASKVIGTIHTTVDEQAPTISKVRSEATIFPGKTERTQTIIYWETDEPSTSQVFWKEGVGAGELTASSRLDKEYTTSHVAVITNFAPGAVYRFQVESVDPSGNASRSSDYTILTPKKGETVIDLIITNFQGIFGFLKNL